MRGTETALRFLEANTFFLARSPGAGLIVSPWPNVCWVPGLVAEKVISLRFRALEHDVTLFQGEGMPGR